MASEIVRVWLADPLEGWDPDAELPAQATKEQAELRAASIRLGVERFVRDVAPLMLQAYLCRDWIALEYESWSAYVRARWAVDQLRLSTEDRQTVARLFRVYGASSRAIGTALNVDQRTVRRDLKGASGAAGAAPETVTGTDGKAYPATRQHTAETNTWYCQSCGHAWPVEATGSNECPECGGRGGFEPKDREPSERDAGYIANPDERLAVAAELVPESTREVEWPTVATPGGVVDSATPAGPTGEAPGDEAAEVTYRAWRKHFVAGLGKLTRDLDVLVSDPQTIASRADDAAIEELERFAAQLSDFCRRVRELRPTTHLVWMSATRRGLDYHRPAPGGEFTVEPCRRSMRTGKQVERQQAIKFYQAKPCKRCWPNRDEETDA